MLCVTCVYARDITNTNVVILHLNVSRLSVRSSCSSFLSLLLVRSFSSPGLVHTGEVWFISEHAVLIPPVDRLLSNTITCLTHCFIHKQIELAKVFEEKVLEDERFEVHGNATMGLVCFRLQVTMRRDSHAIVGKMFSSVQFFGTNWVVGGT